MLYTFVVNWDYVGGARGAYILQPRELPFGIKRYIHILFGAMVAMAAFALVVARVIETSAIGRGLAAIRDDELAAECAGVPTLRLKIVAASVSGALMGMAGTHVSVLPLVRRAHPPRSTSRYAVNSIAMPLIGGMMSWLGPLLGAVLLGTVQQVVQVTVSSEWNLLIVGVLLVVFVTRRARTASWAGMRSDGSGRGPGEHERAAPRSLRPHQALRRLHRAGRRGPGRGARRAARPDRPQRLGQDHARQLHLRAR